MTITARRPALALGILIGTALASLLGAPPALAADQERAALVIGNASYRGEKPLVNTLNDSADMARKLTALGFRVTEQQDLGRRDLARALNDFVRQVRGSDGVALFYYSGHGLQVGGKNYLVPVDAQLRDELDVPTEAIPVDTLLAGLGQRGDNAVNLIVLDACRNNPLQRSDRKSIGDKGLARVEAPSGTLILYATRPGQTASDNPSGRNGLFTQHLLAALDQPGVPVEETFKQVAREVYTSSGKAQSPWQEGVLFGQFFFRPPTGRSAPPPPPPVAVGYLQISIDAPGARVWLDGREVGIAEPGAPLNLSNLPLGTVRVAAVAPGRQRVERTVALQSGTWVQVALSLPTAAPVVGDTWTEPRTGMEFVWVPGGSFRMGCGGAWAGECDDDEKPARQVTLKGYWMAKTEVTQAQWQQVMGNNPSHFQGCANCPVEQVSWTDAQAFIGKLDPGGRQGLRLPTEAEWEYACRSGGKEELYCGGSDLDRLAWNKENSGGKTHPVGGKAANGLGLSDMSGNVWEWTCSVYANPYNGAEQRCERNNDATSARVMRGGSWGVNPWFARAAFRYYDHPENRNYILGLRLARTLSP